MNNKNPYFTYIEPPYEENRLFLQIEALYPDFYLQFLQNDESEQKKEKKVVIIDLMADDE
tara:strand:+ start:951 stop:1130 length:180 start_codon:yes stop_codon:yes gene_type:complete